MRRALGLLTAAVLALAAMAPSSAMAASCPALDYQATLATAAAALHVSPADVAVAQREVSALLQADASRSAAVQPVLDDLAVTPPDIDDARTRLDAMSATLAYPANSTCNVDGGAARATLHDVYASPAFRHLDDVAQTSFLDAIGNAIDGVLGGLARGLGVLGGLLLAVLVLGLAGLIAWRRWHHSAGFGGAALAEPAGRGDDPDAEWTAAERAADGGEYREAVRRAFRSALLEVAVRGRARFEAAWTTRELLERCNADGDVLVALAAAATLFDRAWYSGVAVTRADWEHAAQRCQAIRRLALRATAPTR
jgi:hypothetical protein